MEDPVAFSWWTEAVFQYVHKILKFQNILSFKHNQILPEPERRKADAPVRMFSVPTNTPLRLLPDT